MKIFEKLAFFALLMVIPWTLLWRKITKNEWTKDRGLGAAFERFFGIIGAILQIILVCAISGIYYCLNS